MLDESVFKYEELFEMFGQVETMFEIAKYNISLRSIKQVEGMDLDRSKLRIRMENNMFGIYYQDKDDMSYSFISCDYSKEKFGTPHKPTIFLKFESKELFDHHHDVFVPKCNQFFNIVHDEWNISSEDERLKVLQKKLYFHGRMKLLKTTSWIDIYEDVH